MKLGTVVMLAGSIRPTALMTSLGLHALELPVRADATLLDTWIESLQACNADEVRIVVNSPADAARIGALLPSSRQQFVRVMSEPASWRGSAGLVSDLTADLAPDDLVAVVEGGSLPPVSLAPLAGAMTPLTTAVIGATEAHEPAGTYLFRRNVFRSIPSVGYHDMKEQLLPAINEQRGVVKLAILGREFIRIRDRQSYLSAVALLAQRYENAMNGRLHDDGARLLGSNVISAAAAIGPRALVQDSVLFDGATVEPGAVVCRSIIGPGVTIAAGSRVVDSIVTERPSPAGASRTSVRQVVARN